MEKHAMALGYFFLAVFCLFASSQNPAPLRTPLLLAAFVAGLMGLGFLASACRPQFRAIQDWFVQLLNQLRLERDVSPRSSTVTEDRPA